jgi:DNA-binding NarL/FixJ family response regulator
MTGTPLRLLLVDDDVLVRSGLRVILESEPDLTVVGDAGTGREALAEAARTDPDVVLMDVRMPRLDGIEATRQIVNEGGADGPCVLVVTTFELDEYVFGALHAGASGFLLKDISPEGLVEAVRTVHAGESLLAPAITRRLVEEFVRSHVPRTGPPPELADLTPRELDVLRHMARGLSNAEIAEQLVLGESTIKTHVGRILTKLRLRDRVQAVVLAYEAGLAKPGA